MTGDFTNPFRPGAGHRPPYLAGRQEETNEFKRLLLQDVILSNFILSGLRGVGKTVLLDTFKPLAIKNKWIWVGTDLSESTSISEETIATRLLTDLAVVTSSMEVGESEIRRIGFGAAPEVVKTTLNYDLLDRIYKITPGLVADKLKAVLELVSQVVKQLGVKGLVFAYDEAQNLADHSEKEQYPLSLLLDVFQSIQKKEVPFMLVLVGLPTLFPKLVEARTYSERMFRVVFLDRLNEKDSKEAIEKPIQSSDCPFTLEENSIKSIVELSCGYPYFIQFICREVFDSFVQGQENIPLEEITRKLDSDFFAGRWAKATDRQRELLTVAANLPSSDSEFTVQELMEKSKEILDKPFSSSHINQMLAALANSGLVYKNRHGKYSFAVPLMNRYVLRQSSNG